MPPVAKLITKYVAQKHVWPGKTKTKATTTTAKKEQGWQIHITIFFRRKECPEADMTSVKNSPKSSPEQHEPAAKLQVEHSSWQRPLLCFYSKFRQQSSPNKLSYRYWATSSCEGNNKKWNWFENFSHFVPRRELHERKVKNKNINMISAKPKKITRTRVLFDASEALWVWQTKTSIDVQSQSLDDETCVKSRVCSWWKPDLSDCFFFPFSSWNRRLAEGPSSLLLVYKAETS